MIDVGLIDRKEREGKFIFIEESIWYWRDRRAVKI